MVRVSLIALVGLIWQQCSPSVLASLFLRMASSVPYATFWLSRRESFLLDCLMANSDPKLKLRMNAPCFPEAVSFESPGHDPGVAAWCSTVPRLRPPGCYLWAPAAGDC